MTKLQKPKYAYMGGRIVDWDDARIHVASESLIRGISVFEGIKGYWNADETDLGLLALRAHFSRLKRSAQLNEIPFDMEFDGFSEACMSLVRALHAKGSDLWIRPTVYSVQGNWGLDTESDLVITCYQQPKQRPPGIEVGISTWQRPLDNALPARIKSAANYQASRLARIEGRSAGFEDMILLNPMGRVAEATGSCLLMVREDCVFTPPAYEGCLESITVGIVEQLCETLHIPFKRRPVERSELFIADELCLVGTLMEFGHLRRIGHRPMPAEHRLIGRIADEFWAAVRGSRPHPAVELTSVLGGQVGS